MTGSVAVAIVGAGPYGLSIAAHLSAHGIDCAVFGPPMDSWRAGMPRGMRLKSEGFATNLSDPDGAFTLKTFCVGEGIPYSDIGVPVAVETFAAYGMAFQQRFVPRLDRRVVRKIARRPHGFSLDLEDGSTVTTRRVVVATGIAPYRHVPAVLAGLSPARLGHTSDRADYSPFACRRVMVVGAGASAIDAAAALHRAGAIVRLVSRKAAVTFYESGPRTWRDRIVAPMTPLGPGWKKLLCVKAPLLFHALPERVRVAIVRRYLGPAANWWARGDFDGKVTMMLSSRVIAARETPKGVDVEIVGPNGRVCVEQVDHVVAGTGYSVDVRNLPFLDPVLAGGVALTERAPRLSSHFESSVTGLYFVGTASAFAFGPMLRFVCGAGFAARRVAAHVAAAEARRARVGVSKHAPARGALRVRRQVGPMSAVAPKRVLFLTLLDDAGSDRIVAAMGRLGCECAVIGSPTGFAAHSRFATTLFPLPRFGSYWLRGLVLRWRLAGIVRHWKPDLLIPLDDFSAQMLRDPRVGRDPDVARLIEASLGNPAGYATICSRDRLIGEAAALGLRTPGQAVVDSLAAAKQAAAAFGYPLVLKREQTCGGFGVVIVANEDALVEAFGKAKRKAERKRAIQTLLRLTTAGRDAIVVQAYIPGTMAFRVVACADGIVLDGISFLAECTNPPVTGASTVVRPIDRPDMEAMTQALVASLGCSGLVSLDFILSPDGACLIEMNPRPVASGHLGALYGHDLYDALVQRLRGLRVARDSGLEDGPETVALFPRELDRDPHSPALDRPSETLHDLPWDDLDVLDAYAAWLERRHPAERETLRRRLMLGNGSVSARDLRALVASIDRYPG